MKKFLFAVFSTIIALMFIACEKKEAFKKELTNDGYKVVIISDQPPHVGINKWKVYVYTIDGKPVENAVVKNINGYMPPMPGMPEMSFDYKVVKVGDHYESDVNLSMGGTWQMTILVEIDGKPYEFKFGFNL